jgi:hypothetical protein
MKNGRVKSLGNIGLKLLAGAMLLPALWTAASAGPSYNSDSPDAKYVSRTEFAKSMGPVKAKPGTKIAVVLKI